MFNNLRNRLRKRAFASTALIKTNDILHYLFNSEEAYERSIGIRVLKEKGEDAMLDFRKHIVETVLEIVQSDNYVIAMRKQLISNIRSDCMNRLLWTEKFHNRRQVIYDEFNKDIDDPGLFWSDENTASTAAWSDAESFCLRLLQASMFEEVSEDDWWTTYVKAYEEFVINIYRAILAKADGDTYSMSYLFVKPLKDTIRDFESKLIEEYK